MNRNMRNARNRKQKINAEKKLDYKKIVTLFTIFVLLILLIIVVDKKNNGKISYKELEAKVNENLNFENENNNYNELIKNENVINEEKSNKNEKTTFTLTAIGDTLCHNTQYWDAEINKSGVYDFSYVYKEIENYTKITDLTIGSLETSFAGADRGYSNYPVFNSPDELAEALQGIGVDILSLAGNHCLDYGYTGLCRTIDVLDGVGISHLGTYKTQEEQEKILIKYVKGVKIAFINYTYGTNGIPVPEDKPFCVNLINKELMKKQIEQAKNAKVDMIVACMHWGTEYKTIANDEQKELADFLFKNGVDVIIGNHPHVLEPMEKRTITMNDGTVKDVFVIYALGNFTADQRDEITRDSIILNLTITKNEDGRITIDKVDYVPIYMYKNSSVSTHKFKILDIEKSISLYESGTDTSIGENVYNNLKKQLEKIKSIVGEKID